MRTPPSERELELAAQTPRNSLRGRARSRRQARSADGTHRRAAPRPRRALLRLRLSGLAGLARAPETGLPPRRGALRALSGWNRTRERVSRAGGCRANSARGSRNDLEMRGARGQARAAAGRASSGGAGSGCPTAPGSRLGSTGWSRIALGATRFRRPWRSRSRTPETDGQLARAGRLGRNCAASPCRSTNTRRCGCRCAAFHPR